MRNAGVLILLLFTFIATISQAAANGTFVEACLGNLTALPQPITCRTGAGETVRLAKSSQGFALQSKILSGVVQRIQHLPPRFEDAGFIDESVRFVAQGINGRAGTATMTIAFQCRERQYAYIGVANGNGMPVETIAECH